MTRKLLQVVLVAGMIACSSPKTVETGDAQAVAEASSTAKVLAVDTTTSVITWIGSKPNGKHNGTIPVVNGNISVSEGAIQSGSFTFDIKKLQILDMQPSDEGYGKLYGHLMSADFFLADSFPTATFEIVSIAAYDSTQVVSTDEFETEFRPATLKEFMVENPTHMVTGNLTMRGTTKSLSFPVAINVSETGVAAEARFNINRTDWGLQYGDEATAIDKAKDRFIYNTVNVGFSIQAN